MPCINPVIRQVVLDFICLAIVWIPVAVLNFVGEPFKRGFYCDDDSIRYPFKENTITNVMLYLFSFGLPILTMIVVEVVRWRSRTGKNSSGSGGAVHRSSSVQLGRIRIPSVIAELIHLIAIFLFGAACSQLTTDFGKYTIGRLRPHFLDVCKPKDLDQLCSSDQHRYLTDADYVCTGEDAHRLKDSRLSFPSGHASFSAYTMLYLVFYLQRRMTWSGSRLIRPTYQIAILMLAWYCGLSRVSDYKHHWSDVLSGFLIGAIAASLTALYVSKLFDLSFRKDAPLLPTTNNHSEDIGMDQHRHSYTETPDK